MPAEPADSHGKKNDPVVLLTLNGSVQWVPPSGDVTRYRSVGCGVSVQAPWLIWHCATKPTGSSLSPIFVTVSKAPCQARVGVHVVPPSLETETQALLNGPICE